MTEEIIFTDPYSLYKTTEEDYVYYVGGSIINIEDLLCINDEELIDEVLYEMYDVLIELG